MAGIGPLFNQRNSSDPNLDENQTWEDPIKLTPIYNNLQNRLTGLMIS